VLRANREDVMSKELAKFQAAYKKIEDNIKRCAHDKVKAAADAYSLRAMDVSSVGEDNVRDSLANARDAGVTGNKLADFQKFGGFKDAVATLKKAAVDLEKERVALAALCGDAAKTQAEAEKLLGSISKDLKSRKDKSATKTDIEAMHADLGKVVADLKKSSAAYGKVQKWRLDYPGQVDTAVAKLLAEAPATQAATRDDNMMPQMLVDRMRKKQLNQVTGALKEVNGAVDDAIAAAGTDLKSAQPHLKKAAGRLADLGKVRDGFKAAIAHADKSGALNGTKDEAAVRKVMDQMDKAYDAGERRVRGAAATIRKAAV
jgi:hypothetical protein